MLGRLAVPKAIQILPLYWGNPNINNLEGPPKLFRSACFAAVSLRFGGQNSLAIFFGTVQEPPARTTLSEKYWQYTSNLHRSTPPICNAVPCWLLSLEERETPQCTSHLYRSTPPICTAVRLSFVPALLLIQKVLEFLGRLRICIRPALKDLVPGAS